MKAGTLVFPVIMGAFVLFFFGFVLTTPVNEATASPDSRLVRARDGDSVLIEFTAYFGEVGKGTVFFSTQEERFESFPPSDIQAGLQDEPIAIHLAADDPAGGLRAYLLNKRAGDEFTTPTVPAAQAFGDWQGERRLPRVLAELSYDVTLDSTTPTGPTTFFNTTEYLAFWQSRGQTLQVGTEWPCEGTELWTCRVESIDTATNTFVYSRRAEPGKQYPMSAIWGNLPVGGDMNWNVTIDAAQDAGNFSIRMDPPIGTRFQFLQNAGGPFVAGTYEVKAITNTEIINDYSSITPAEPALIGENVYYDVEVVSVTRR